MSYPARAGVLFFELIRPSDICGQRAIWLHFKVITAAFNLRERVQRQESDSQQDLLDSEASTTAGEVALGPGCEVTTPPCLSLPVCSGIVMVSLVSDCFFST